MTVSHKNIFILVYILSALIFIAHIFYVGSSVWGDGRYYYSFLRSSVLDRDLDFENEYAMLGISFQSFYNGVSVNKFSIGPAFFWLPFFIFAHLLSLLLATLGIPLAADGFDWAYQISVGLGSIFYAVTGLYLCYLGLKKITDKTTSLMACLSIYFASNLFFYTAVDPINSHSLSFFTASLLFYLIIKSWKEKIIFVTDILITGFAVGLLGLIRNQDLIWGLIPAYILLSSNKLHLYVLLANKSANLPKYLHKIIGLFILATASLLVLVPQLLIWKMMLGKIVSPYIALGEKFYWLQPQILNVLFSTNHGLFLYSPILIFSILGLTLIKGGMRWLGLLSLLLFALQAYIVGSWHSWWAGESYGNRMFISLMPLFILGMSFWIKKFGLSVKLYTLLSILAAVNLGTIIWYLIQI